MLQLVKADNFFLAACPKSVELFYQGERDQHADCRPSDNRKFSKALNAKVLESAAVKNAALNVEQTVGKGSPNSVRKVDGNGSNRVVDVKLEVQELNYKHDDDSRNAADYRGAQSVNRGASRSDGHKAGERGVQGHRNVGLSVLEPSEKHCHNGRDRRRDCRCRKDGG